ncbi:ThuA domain-containing protein [Ravibacter arvi]|uniref:ThuA domain-containing protein n=1 Tax=Ravibacter arvi TaxID=2051041 RepID=A0ABP8LVS6_9BACT
MTIRPNLLACCLSILFIFGCAGSRQQSPKKTATVQPRRAEVLFLGHHSKHHDADKFAPWLSIKLFRSGVNTTYTTQLEDLNPENLAKFDGLIIYANHEYLPPAQEAALKQFVSAGKALIPLHSASGCFRNSDWYISTIGGAFDSHKTGTFKNVIANARHPVMAGITEFETWDETYVHKRINPDIEILGYRVEGDRKEPYTWVRTEGKARVFYTAYGHEDKTWTHIGFLNLVRNGVLWALGDEVQAGIRALNIRDVDIYNADTISKYAQRHVVPKIQEPLSPAEAQKIMQVHPDFDLVLFAAEPDIINPIAMTWDERGRLWVVESVDYPNTFVETDGAANDRIKICEDTDGDGKADKFTVFADSLNIPTSIVLINGGALVSMAPNFIFLKDTNGDDRADLRETVISGWGKFDTHAGPSNLLYGFDNKVWGVVGYSGFNGTINGSKHRFPQGLYRFKPDGTDFEYLGSSSNNTWGLGLTEDNNVFISTANNTHSAYYSMPMRLFHKSLAGDQKPVQAIQKIDGHYEAHHLTPNSRQVDVTGGFTSAAGHRFYTARNFPKSYWNRVAFVNEPTIRLVHNALIERDGAGFKEADGWNLTASSDEWFGPVYTDVGPDGAVWVADWYNFIIQHNVFVPRQSPSEFILPFNDQPHGQGNAFSSPLRDTNHGRIYRIVYKHAKKHPPLKLSKTDLPGLLAALENDNMFWRMTAQRLLVESQNRQALDGLCRLIEKQLVDEVGLNSPAVHALWTLHGLGLIEDQKALAAAKSALLHPAAGVRKAAVQVLPKNDSSFRALYSAGMLQDADLNTRLAVFVELAAYPASEKIGKALFEAAQNLQNSSDKWLSRALFAAIDQHSTGFEKALRDEPEPGAFVHAVSQSLKKSVYPVPRSVLYQDAPKIAGKAFSFSADLSKPADKPLAGFIVGQGNRENGYAVFVKDGKVNFTVNQHGRHVNAVSKTSLPEKFSVRVALHKSGKMTIHINGEEAGTAEAAGLFHQNPGYGFRSGGDFQADEAPIGDYTGSFELAGNFQNGALEVTDPETESKPAAAHMHRDRDVTYLVLKAVPDMMAYDQKLLTVKAGSKVSITFDNQDAMQHNLLVIRPGSLNRVGKAADELLRDPKAFEKQYVPATPDILYSTKLIEPGAVVSLEFTAPAQTGDYPYVCTFPGHWRGMNGILRVVR